jgi:hypothetical protein
VTGGATQTFTGNNTYTNGTTVSGATLYANNSTSSTGSGAVAVNSSGKLAGNGKVSGAVTVGATGTGTLSSGGVQTSDSSHTVITGTGLTLASTLTVDAGSTLQFALGSGASTGYNAFSNPNQNSTFLNVSGLVSFASTGSNININLVDLTAYSTTTTLQLRYNNPYLLIDALGGVNADYADLTTSGGGTAANPANGYVLGINNGTTTAIANNFSFTVTNIANGSVSPAYNGLQLYLYNGQLEVVPEPSTWAMMLGGFALLVLIQIRRRSKNS